MNKLEISGYRICSAIYPTYIQLSCFANHDG